MKLRRLAPYALAVLLPLAMLALRQAMPVSFEARTMLILFMFPIIVSALLGGLGPGLLATVASGGLTSYFLVPPVGRFAFAAGYDLVQWGLLLANGVLVSLMSHALFRTQRREATAREKQRQSEASYGAIFEQAAVGIARVAPDGHFLRVNAKFCAILGYSEAELQARTFMDITHPEDLPADLEQVRRLHANEISSFSREKRFLHKDGTPVWARIHITVVRKPDGTPDYRIGVIEDIASQKMTDEALRERERRLAAIIGFSPSALSLKTPDGRYALANPNLQRIHHCDEAGIVGKTDFDLYPDEVARAFRANDQSVLATRSRQSVEESVPVEGEMRAYLSHMFPVVDDKGEVEYICRISLDITDHKRAEAAQKASSALQEEARRATLSLLEDAQAAHARAEDALKSLRESEGRFRALVEQSLAGIYIIQDGRFRYVNPGFAAMFGYGSADEIIEQVPFSELVMPEDRARVAENIRQRVAGEISDIHYTFAGQRRDGGRIEVEVHGRRFDYQGQPAVIGLILDITARKAAEDSLRESELRFHDIVNASADWVWEVDVQGRYTYASESVRDLLGYGPEELLGNTPFDLMPPEEAARVAADFSALAARKAPFRDLENVNRRKDGRLIHVATNGMPILGADGQLLGYRGLDRDITEKKTAEAALRQSEERYRLLFESSEDALMTLGPPNWRFRSANLAALRIFGADRLDRLTALGPWDVLPETQPDGSRSGEAAQAWIQQAMRDGAAHFEWQHRRLNGEPFAADVLLTRIAQQDEVLLQATVRDISERKAAEVELKARNAELERFNIATVGRELDMIEMKKTINALSRELGREPPYPLAFLKETEEPE
jgi:PAS domain S-box-containing protein